MNKQELINRWNSPEGHPYKGQLIDRRAYERDPDNIGCMCAQGQVLHLIGGWSAERLSEVKQREADRATADLLGISFAHAVLLRIINDSVDGAPAIVLTDPEKVIGDQAPIILAFWRHLDRMTGTATGTAAWVAAGTAAWAAAGTAAGAAAGYATAEIMDAQILREQGRPFFFLPMFGFADPEAVMAADARVSA